MFLRKDQITPELLRLFRYQKGLNQQDLAARLQIHRTRLARLEARTLELRDIEIERIYELLQKEDSAAVRQLLHTLSRNGASASSPSASLALAEANEAQDDFSVEWFSHSLRIHRRNRGLTQEALAQKIGVGVASPTRWEKGKSVPTLGLLVKLCKALGVSADLLLGLRNNNHYGPAEFTDVQCEAANIVGSLDDKQQLAVITMLRGLAP